MAVSGVTMDASYLLTPFVTWLTAGSLKFVVNSIKAGKPAFGLIGYGGLPSNHSAIVISMVTLIALREGIAHPAFGIAITFAFIVILDASSLRRHVGKQAVVINRLKEINHIEGNLRERIGHTPIEIVAGCIVGSSVAWFIHLIYSV